MTYNIGSSTPGPIRFERETLQAKMLKADALGKTTEKMIPIELRFDPLDGHTCRLVGYDLNRIRRPDLSGTIQKSLQIGCPFCVPAIEEIVPRFSAEIAPNGTIRRGQALAFPNVRPYDSYSAVVVISRDHFIALNDFTLDILVNAMMAARTYIDKVQLADSKAKYHFIAWNYLPPSGGSVVHPHMQCNLGYFPTFYHRQILQASKSYREKNGTNFWKDLVEQEIDREERYVGAIGHTHWLTGFAPKGRIMDVLAIFEGKTSITELSEQDIYDFATGLLQVFRCIDELNLLSFNLSTYSGTDKDQFWAHARIIPRSFLLYSSIETSDYFYYQALHDENICILSPETACRKLKGYFLG